MCPSCVRTGCWKWRESDSCGHSSRFMFWWRVGAARRGVVYRPVSRVCTPERPLPIDRRAKSAIGRSCISSVDHANCVAVTWPGLRQPRSARALHLWCEGLPDSYAPEEYCTLLETPGRDLRFLGSPLGRCYQGPSRSPRPSANHDDEGQPPPQGRALRLRTRLRDADDHGDDADRISDSHNHTRTHLRDRQCFFSTLHGWCFFHGPLLAGLPREEDGGISSTGA